MVTHKALSLPPIRMPQRHGAPIEGVLQHEGEIYSGDDKLGKLCRVLKKGILEVFREDRLIYTVNIEERAKRVLSDRSRDGLTWSKYKGNENDR